MHRLFFALGFLTFINAAGLRCRFGDVEKDKGYTGMVFNGTSRRSAGNTRRVQLLCDTGNHNYTCRSGVLTADSPSQARCGCSIAELKNSTRERDVEPVSPIRGDIVKNGGNATVFCAFLYGTNWRQIYKCENGQWEAITKCFPVLGLSSK